MNQYHAFGLNIQSDLIFPELFPVESDELDVEIKQADALFDFDEATAKSQDTGGGRQFLLKTKNVADFLITDCNLILYRRIGGVEDDTLRLFLLGSCLGCILQQRGYIVLHGNAVSTDGKTCKIIVGHRGAGKSTAAAWHYRQGDRILADDVCAITFDAHGNPLVIPSYPQIKLWKASANLLDINTNGLRRIRSEKDKFAIPLGNQFWREPMPLTEVIELSSTNTVSRTIEGMDKARCLKEHSYRYHFLEKMGMTSDYMKKLLNLAGKIDLRTGVRMSLGDSEAS